MNTKTEQISSGLVAHIAAFKEALNGTKGDLDAWLECNDESEVRQAIFGIISDAEAIISDLQNIVIAENQRKQQLEEEVMWLKAAQPNIALIANKDAPIAKQAAFIEEQKGTITALNIALGGEDSTSTENLVDAYEHDPESVGLCFKYRAAKDKILMQTERIKELESHAQTLEEVIQSQRENVTNLATEVVEQSAALKLAREALFDMQDSYAAVHGWKDSFVIAATTAIAAIDSLQKGE